MHTTLVPEWGAVLSGKIPSPVPAPSPANGRRSPLLQENINPLLNTHTLTASGIAALYQAQGKPDESTKEMKGVSPMIQVPFTAFDTFADGNPFTMKSMDA